MKYGAISDGGGGDFLTRSTRQAHSEWVENSIEANVQVRRN